MSTTTIPSTSLQRTRAWVGVLAVLIGSLAVVRVLLDVAAQSWPRVSPGGPASVDEVLTGLFAWAGCGLAAWLSLGTLAALLAASPGAAGDVCERVSKRITPAVVRKGVSVLISASLGTVALPAGSAGGLSLQHPGVRVFTSLPSAPASLATDGREATPAEPSPGFTDSRSSGNGGVATSATPPDPGFTATTSSPEAGPAPTNPSTRIRTEPAPDPRWLPDRPTTVADPDSSRLLAPSPRVTSAEIESVTVRRGDSLWTIAARQLGAGTSDAEIARAWPQWYAANREVIGVDPNLIIPGQQLQPPTEGPRP